MRKALQVKPLENGTVIDHIQAGRAGKVSRILGLENFFNMWIMACNLDSKAIEKKDMIKIEGRELSSQESNLIALVAPNATISIIKEGEVVEKRKVVLPASVHNFIICPNPNCITNIEDVNTNFKVDKGDHGIEVECCFCEKKYLIDGVKIRT